MHSNFFDISLYNRIVPCSNIPGIDFFKMLPLQIFLELYGLFSKRLHYGLFSKFKVWVGMSFCHQEINISLNTNCLFDLYGN